MKTNILQLIHISHKSPEEPICSRYENYRNTSYRGINFPGADNIGRDCDLEVSRV